jgi:hypothetical protein
MSSLTILDYDDTLLCSTHVKINKASDSEALVALAASVIALLRRILSYGKVVIVSNGEAAWIRDSLTKYLPSVIPLLDGVPIISARDLYERFYPNAPTCWKYYTIERLLGQTQAQNIISFGDSAVEREVVRTLGRRRPGSLTKSVKFASSPSPEQLRRQLELVTERFAYIHDHTSDLDLQLTLVKSSAL